MTYLILLAALGGLAGATRPETQPDCTSYIVIQHPVRVRYLDLLSSPRGLSASGSNLNIRTVVNSLLGKHRHRVHGFAPSGAVVDQVEFRMKSRKPGVALQMTWLSAAGAPVHVTTIEPRDPTLGDVELNVRQREDRSYDVSFGPDPRPLRRSDTAAAHLANGPREILTWEFGAGGELRRMGRRLISPHGADDDVISLRIRD